MSQGMVYLISMFATAIAVAAVYSAAQDAHLGTGALVRKALGRFGKLLGVLAILGLLVGVLSRI